MGTETPSKSWWATLPGLVTAIGGLITAVAVLLTTLKSVGLFDVPAPQISQERVAPVPIRFWIKRLPKVPGADAAKLFNNALGSWQAVVTTPIRRADSEAEANVLIETSPETIAVANVGPPTGKDLKPLMIVFGSTHAWTARSFEASSCRMLGHILGLTYTKMPGQIMSENAKSDSLPLTPQREDVKRVRQIWEH